MTLTGRWRKISANFKVLLCEDSPDNRLLVDHYLKKTPYKLDMAENGREGFDLFIKQGYDIVLMDIEIAGKERDGRQVEDLLNRILLYLDRVKVVYETT